MQQLTAKDLIIGEKYIPHSKTIYSDHLSLEWYHAKRSDKPYLIYKGKDDVGHIFSRESTIGGDYFRPEDVTPCK